MKKIFCVLLLFIGGMLCFTPRAHALEKFYEGEYIHNIFMVRENNHSHIYQAARFIRRNSDHQFAYCIEPFSFVDTTQAYESMVNPDTIPKETWERISLIAYYGYGYPNHSSNKWYPITQIMIWKAIDPESDFYFTDSLDGNKIDIFQEEMNEIEALIQKHQQKPSFHNQTITMVLGTKKTITDQNYVFSSYQSNNLDPSITQSENTLTIYAEQVGEKQISWKKTETQYMVPPLLYYHPTSQNLMTVGMAPTNQANLKIKVIETNLIINKIDKDTQTQESQGEAQLEGAIYELYDHNHNLIQTITIPKTKTITIPNLDFGTYYIKEKQAGIGYQLDPKQYHFTINENTHHITLNMENEVIKKKIELYKKFGDLSQNEMQPEENIQFAIYDKQGNLITTLTTDHNGYATTILPYGKYTIKQLNSTNGYQKVDDFEIIVDEKSEDTLTYTLDDIKIPVPNTKENQNNLHATVIISAIMIGLIYAEKKKQNRIHSITR